MCHRTPRRAQVWVKSDARQTLVRRFREIAPGHVARGHFFKLFLFFNYRRQTVSHDFQVYQRSDSMFM